ncbi:MAG TPA: ATP-binding protein [Anaerolineae bacterium]|nr:ATP-binding protein [Anaerolineae bacterium]
MAQLRGEVVKSRAQVNNTLQEMLDPAQIPYLAADLEGLLAALLKAAKARIACDGAAAAARSGSGFKVLASVGQSAALLGSTFRLQDLRACGQELLAGRVAVVTDTAATSSWAALPGQEQARSWLAAPFATEGETIGILMWTAREPGRFGEEALASAAAFAEHAAPTVRWAERIHHVSEQARRRGAAPSSPAGPTTTPDAQLDTIAQVAHELAGARDAFIYLVDREGGGLRCVAATGHREKALGHTALRNDGSLSAWVVAPPSLAGVKAPGHSDRDALQALGMKDTLLLPLVVEGRPIGFLGVADRRDGAPFGEYGTRVLTELAGRASKIAEQIGTSLVPSGPVDYGMLVPPIPVPVGVLTAAGQINFANPALSQLVLHPPQALYDRYLSEFMGVGDSRRFTSALGRVVTTGEYQMMGLRLGSQGHRRSVQMSMASLQAMLGNGGRVLVVFDDGSDGHGDDGEPLQQVKELQEKIEALAELDVLRSRFVSDVSHELRTPLAVIKLHATLARIGRPERRTYYLQTIEQETHRLEMMVENILDLGRIDRQGLEIHCEWLEPEEIIARVLEVYLESARQKGITLTSDVARPLPRLWADKNHVVQMLINLVDNALKYTRTAGRIWVEARPGPPGAPPALEVIVGDTGSGIPPDEQEKVFERFYRGTNNPPGATGTGLGLSIIRDLMEAHGGSIALVSRQGEGSVFTLRFPVPAEGEAQPAPRPGQAPQPGQTAPSGAEPSPGG